MTPARLLSFGRIGPTIAIAFFAAMLATPTSEAFGRGGYGSMRAYQRVMKQTWTAYQKQVEINQKQQKERDEAFLKRFDTNNNGKIDGKEKAPAKKYLREIELGHDPDKAIKSMGRSSSSFGPRTRTKPASSKTKSK